MTRQVTIAHWATEHVNAISIPAIPIAKSGKRNYATKGKTHDPFLAKYATKCNFYFPSCKILGEYWQRIVEKSSFDLATHLPFEHARSEPMGFLSCR
jgi:hypothetical protein